MRIEDCSTISGCDTCNNKAGGEVFFKSCVNKKSLHIGLKSYYEDGSGRGMLACSFCPTGHCYSIAVVNSQCSAGTPLKSDDPAKCVGITTLVPLTTTLPPTPLATDITESQRTSRSTTTTTTVDQTKITSATTTTMSGDGGSLSRQTKPSGGTTTVSILIFIIIIVLYVVIFEML
jgi:hypothetical protein